MFLDVILERLDGIDAVSDAHVVIHQGVFAGSKPELAFASLQGMQVFDNALVVGHEGEGARHLPKHHRLAPENFGTFVGIYAGVIHPVTATDHKPPEAHFFHRFYKAAFLVPHGRIPAAGAEGFRHLHNPFGLDFGALVQEDAARFADFGAKEPFHTLAVQIATGEYMRFAAAHQSVATVFDITAGNTSEETRKKRDVQIIGMETIQRADAVFAFHVENAAELFVEVNPFTATQKMEAELVAEFAQLVPGFSVPFGAEGIPHANVGEKVALVPRKLAMQLADTGALRLLAGDHSRVLNRECRADN